MYFILKNASFPTTIGTITVQEGQVGGGGGSSTPTNVTFTINPTPSTATVVLTASGYTQSGNSITVLSGTKVNYTVSASGYTSKSGSKTVSYTQSLGVTLSAEGSTPVNPPSEGTLITSGSLKDSYLIEQAGYVSNTYSEGVQADTVYFIYDLIPVEPNTTYRLQYGRAAFFLKSDKSQIDSRVNLTSGYDNWTFTTPSSCAYLSVAFKYSEVATSAVVLESASVGEWVEKSTTLIKDTGAAFTDGYGWQSSSYTPKASEGFYSYAEIPVKASTRYKVENARSTWFLASNKTAINRINISKDTTDFIFETPANAAYLSTCWQHAEKNKDEASIVEYEFIPVT